jgi:hypothetical protein
VAHREPYRGVGRAASRLHRYELEDWLWYAVVPCGLYIVLVVAGPMLLAPSRVVVLFLVAGAALGLLLLGIRNSWDTITYVAANPGVDHTTGTENR